MQTRFIVNLLAAGVLCVGLGACVLEWDDDSSAQMLANDQRDPSPTFSIGGTVVGSAGPVALQNSNGTILIAATDGSFTFETPMVSSALYNVTVVVPPTFQTCRVANGAGTVGRSNISNVTVTCSPNTYTASNTPASSFPRE